MKNEMVVDENFDWLQAHRKANKSLQRQLKKDWIMDHAKDEIQEVLLGLEIIRDVARRIMRDRAADLALDVLLCIANEVRLVKSLHTPIDRDSNLLVDCQDDNEMYIFLEQWFRWKKWEQ